MRTSVHQACQAGPHHPASYHPHRLSRLPGTAHARPGQPLRLTAYPRPDFQHRRFSTGVVATVPVCVRRQASVRCRCAFAGRPASSAGVRPWCVTPVSPVPKSRLIRALRLIGGIPVPSIDRRTGINRGNVTAGAGDPALRGPARDRGAEGSPWSARSVLKVPFHDPRPGPDGAPRIPFRFLNITSTAGTGRWARYLPGRAARRVNCALPGRPPVNCISRSQVSPP